MYDGRSGMFDIRYTIRELRIFFKYKLDVYKRQFQMSVFDWFILISSLIGIVGYGIYKTKGTQDKRCV